MEEINNYWAVYFLFLSPVMWRVLLLWVILWLPALQLFQAKETHGDVWAVLWRCVDEAGFGHLQE